MASMRSRLSGELLRFGVAGLAGLAVDVGVLYAVMWLGAGPLVGRVLSFLAAVYTTWRINRRFTFNEGAGSTWMQWWRYLFAMAGGGAVNYGVYCAVLFVAMDALRGLAPLVAVACGSLAGMSLNFLSAKLLVFKPHDER